MSAGGSAKLSRSCASQGSFFSDKFQVSGPAADAAAGALHFSPRNTTKLWHLPRMRADTNQCPFEPALGSARWS